MPEAVCGEIEVLPDFDESLVSVECVGFDRDGPIDVGDGVNVIFEVINDNPQAGVIEYEVTVNGSQEATESATVAGSASVDRVEFIEFTQPGDKDISVGLVSAQEA